MEAKKEATKKYMVKQGATITQAGVWIRPGNYVDFTEAQYKDYKELVETPEAAAAIETERKRVAKEKADAAAKALNPAVDTSHLTAAQLTELAGELKKATTPVAAPVADAVQTPDEQAVESQVRAEAETVATKG